jgi:hypothetical protein
VRIGRKTRGLNGLRNNSRTALLFNRSRRFRECRIILFLHRRNLSARCFKQALVMVA